MKRLTEATVQTFDINDFIAACLQIHGIQNRLYSILHSTFEFDNTLFNIFTYPDVHQKKYRALCKVCYVHILAITRVSS